MIVGVPKEVKVAEKRVALTPAGARELITYGHKVIVEYNAGAGSGYSDQEYAAAGANIVDTLWVWEAADFIVGVKEPIASEWHRIRRGQTIFTYFHLAASEELTRALLRSGATCIAYETVELADRTLPLLIPMSQVAGSMAPLEGAKYLQSRFGGCGVLLPGVPGVSPANVVILGGGGVAGSCAARIAVGLGADVYALDTSEEKLQKLCAELPEVNAVISTRETILTHIARAHLVIGAVLVHGAKAPKLILEDDLNIMRDGAVIVDVAVDQGGCVETIKPRTHDDPVYTVRNAQGGGIVHYGVANMPGAYPHTSTKALTNATMPYVLEIARRGWQRALAEDEALCKGLNICNGNVTYKGVADEFGLEYVPPENFLAK